MAHVLISKIGGSVDYATDGDVNVVLVDFDKLDQAFPDQIEQLIAEVKTLPRTIPWRADVLLDLEARRADALRHPLPQPSHGLNLVDEELRGTG